MADHYRTLDDLDVKGKRVLVRADLNVPMQDGKITDTPRIDRQAPTIRELAEKGARVIVLSHFGRPKGKVVPSMSLAPIAPALAKAVGRDVAFAADCIGDVAKAAVGEAEGRRRPAAGKHALPCRRGKATIPTSPRRWPKLGDLYVNDAFSAAHRAHASTEGIAHLLPSAAGRAMQSELEHLHKALDNPERPVMAVVGGAKVSTKIALIENLLDKVDMLVIGGAMANTFLAAEGLDVGKSLYEKDQLDTANRIVERGHRDRHGAAAADRCGGGQGIQGGRGPPHGRACATSPPTR